MPAGVRGSHHAGRVDHVLTGDQAGADLERVNELAKRLELVYVEMEPGDAVFFHSNTFTAAIRTTRSIPGGQ